MPRLLFILTILALCRSANGQASLSERLAALDPAQPAQYKLLAEQLAAKSSDAESRATALRLFHIAAWLDPDRLAAGSLRSMIAIARSPEEEKRFRAAAYLLDPTADQRMLQKSVISAAHSGSSAPEELLQAIQQLRQGRRTAATKLAAAPTVRDYLAAEENQSLREELRKLFAGNNLSERQLRQLLELELQWLPPSEEPGIPQASSTEAWSKLGGEAIATPTRSVTLLDLTEFDPRECVYRGRKFTVDSKQ